MTHFSRILTLLHEQPMTLQQLLVALEPTINKTTLYSRMSHFYRRGFVDKRACKVRYINGIACATENWHYEEPNGYNRKVKYVYYALVDPTPRPPGPSVVDARRVFSNIPTGASIFDLGNSS